MFFRGYMFVPNEFLLKMKKLLPEKEVEELIKIIDTPLRKSIRVNSLKANPKEIKESLEKQGFVLTDMPWYKYGFFAEGDETHALGNTFEHYLGKIYIQEAASMLPVIALEPKPEDFVLDMAASPGSKTTQISMHMKNRGLIVANEPSRKRLSPLQSNLDKSSTINSVITRNDGRRFANHKDIFDKVLLDAPCSSEGTFQKDKKARFIWSQKKVIANSILQKQLIDSAIACTKPGGTIVYSTCTMSPEEDEEIIEYAINKYDNLKIEPLTYKNLKTSKGITKYNDKTYSGEMKKVIRIWPHKTNIEGFFVAKLKKE